MHHEQYMTRCLDLARMAYPACRPNPMVGALVVHDGKIISEGCTQAYGEAHAEVMAIRGVSDELLRESTIYVSLEPCAHHGKTPPCADLILEKCIPRVVIACRDPFEKVDGRGIERLRAAGVEVIEGVLSKEARELNKRFFTFHQKKRPYVVLKWAESADGFIDRKRTEGEAAKISSQLTNQRVHQWRSEEQAILVGGNTARQDSPRLDVRWVDGPNPERFLWSSSDLDAAHRLSRAGYSRIEASSVREVLASFYERGIQSVLVEGGAQVLQQFIDSASFDEIRRVLGEVELVDGVKAPRLMHDSSRQEKSGSDVIKYYLPNAVD